MSRLVRKILVFDDGEIEIANYSKSTPLLDEYFKRVKCCKLEDGSMGTQGDWMEELMLNNIFGKDNH